LTIARRWVERLQVAGQVGAKHEPRPKPRREAPRAEQMPSAREVSAPSGNAFAEGRCPTGRSGTPGVDIGVCMQPQSEDVKHRLRTSGARKTKDVRETEARAEESEEDCGRRRLKPPRIALAPRPGLSGVTSRVAAGLVDSRPLLACSCPTSAGPISSRHAPEHELDAIAAVRSPPSRAPVARNAPVGTHRS